MNNKNKFIKIILIGETNVGKTSLFNKYIYNKHIPTESTIGACFCRKQLEYHDKYNIKHIYNLDFWDTAGQERFRSIIRFYYNKCNIAIIMFDVSNKDSWIKIDYWINNINNFEDNVKFIIIGNKNDKNRLVTLKEINYYINKKKIDYDIDYLDINIINNNYNITNLLDNIFIKYIDNNVISNNNNNNFNIIPNDNIIRNDNIHNLSTNCNCFLL